MAPNFFHHPFHHPLLASERFFLNRVVFDDDGVTQRWAPQIRRRLKGDHDHDHHHDHHQVHEWLKLFILSQLKAQINRGVLFQEGRISIRNVILTCFCSPSRVLVYIYIYLFFCLAGTRKSRLLWCTFFFGRPSSMKDAQDNDELMK